MAKIDYGKILVVEDDPAIRETLRVWLGNSGFSVVFADTGPGGLQAFRTESPDLMILDVMLPEMDGLEVCRKVREKSNIPILMLSAQGEFSDKILGLELGADDYLAKPFHPKELIARIRAQLRGRGLAEKESSLQGLQVSYGDLDLNSESYIASFAGKAMDLTRTEFGILFLLASNPGATFSRDRILTHLWGNDFQGEERTVDSHVRNLRHKLKKYGCLGGLVESVWGVGYRLPKQE